MACTRTRYIHQRPAVVALAIALSVGLPACAYVRSVTYPPEFSYLAGDDVSTSMGRMAGHMSHLDSALQNTAMTESARRQAVVTELDGIERVVRDLGAGPTPTNHLLIDANIDSFSRSVRRARLAVEREPPDYYQVGRLSGACSACHLRR